jgi:hypothetical protein
MLNALFAGLNRPAKRGGQKQGDPGAILTWFESLSDDELVLLCAWCTNERFAPLDRFTTELWNDKASRALGIAICTRVDEVHGFDGEGMDSEDGVAMAKRPLMIVAGDRLAKSLDHCLSLRTRRKRSAELIAESGPGAEERLKEMELLIYRARLTPKRHEMAAALAPTWGGSVEDLFDCAATLAV